MPSSAAISSAFLPACLASARPHRDSHHQTDHELPPQPPTPPHAHAPGWHNSHGTGRTIGCTFRFLSYSRQLKSRPRHAQTYVPTPARRPAHMCATAADRHSKSALAEVQMHARQHTDPFLIAPTHRFAAARFRHTVDSETPSLIAIARPDIPALRSARSCERSTFRVCFPAW